MLGLTPSEVHAARKAQSANPRDQAVLELASAIVTQQGKLSARQVAEFQSRGLKDADILEVLVNLVPNIFANYTNHIADTEIESDFQVVGMQLATKGVGFYQRSRVSGTFAFWRLAGLRQRATKQT